MIENSKESILIGVLEIALECIVGPLFIVASKNSNWHQWTQFLTTPVNIYENEGRPPYSSQRPRMLERKRQANGLSAVVIVAAYTRIAAYGCLIEADTVLGAILDTRPFAKLPLRNDDGRELREFESVGNRF